MVRPTVRVLMAALTPEFALFKFSKDPRPRVPSAPRIKGLLTRVTVMNLKPLFGATANTLAAQMSNHTRHLLEAALPLIFALVSPSDFWITDHDPQDIVDLQGGQLLLACPEHLAVRLGHTAITGIMELPGKALEG